MNSFIERYVKPFKDKAILAAWITGLILMISLLWILTQPVQSRYLMRSVNGIFISNNDGRRVVESIQQKQNKTNMMGYWYWMNNNTDKMFVFTVFQDGILVPLGAVVSADGTVKEMLPLSAHAIQVFDSLPESILIMYSKRIESSVRNSDARGSRL